MAGLQAVHIMMRLQRNFVAVTLFTKYFTAVIYISFTSRVGDVYDSHITNNRRVSRKNVNQLHIGEADPLASPLPHLGRLDIDMGMGKRHYKTPTKINFLNYFCPEAL